MATPHKVEIVSNDGTYLDMLVNGVLYHMPLAACSRRLAQAAPVQRMNLELAKIGIDIHWPGIDEDLSVDYLMSKALVIEGALT